MKYILFLTCGVVFATNDLCASWNLFSAFKCVPTQTCCAQDNNFPPNCTLTGGQFSCPSSGTPPNCSSNFYAQEDYAFAGDGTYSLTLLISTGGCPSGILDSTVQTAIISYGGFVEGGMNNIGANWSKITYQPSGSFSGTLVKAGTGHPCFFTDGFEVGGGYVGPCVDLLTLFNDANHGCPCGGNWTSAPFGANATSPATRDFNKTQCVGPNGTTCPEDYFFSTSPRYGSYRVMNISNTTRQLDITRPVLDQNAGWSDTNVYATFTANYSCPLSTQPTPAKSGAAALVSSAMGLASLWMFA